VPGVSHYPLPREHVIISPCIMHASLIGLRRNMAPWGGKKETATPTGEHLIGVTANMISISPRV